MRKFSNYPLQYTKKTNTILSHTLDTIKKMMSDIKYGEVYYNQWWKFFYEIKINYNKKIYFLTKKSKTGDIITEYEFKTSGQLYDMLKNNIVKILKDEYLKKEKIDEVTLNSFVKQFKKEKPVYEVLKLGQWDVPFMNFAFFYDSYADVAYLNLGIKNEKETIKLEIRGMGISKDKKYNRFKIMYPQDAKLSADFRNDFKYFIEDIVYFFNKNKMGYVLRFDTVVNDKNLEPYAVIASDEKYSLSELEKVFASLKDVYLGLKDYWLKNLRIK